MYIYAYMYTSTYMTFGNLLLLYCKYQYYDLAADVMAVPYTLHPAPYTLHPTPWTLNPKTNRPTPDKPLNSKLSTLNSYPRTLNPKP